MKINSKKLNLIPASTYKWKVHNRKIEIISFVVKFHSASKISAGRSNITLPNEIFSSLQVSTANGVSRTALNSVSV
jgi:hypothetical protein